MMAFSLLTIYKAGMIIITIFIWRDITDVKRNADK